MATIYVSHKFGGNPANMERAKKITHDLQIENPTHCFICPLLAFRTCNMVKSATMTKLNFVWTCSAYVTL